MSENIIHSTIENMSMNVKGASDVIIHAGSAVFATTINLECGNVFVWHYKISIFNATNNAITLLSCDWTVVDGFGNKLNECSKNKNHIIQSREIFEYGSYVALTTRDGVMYGSCSLRDNNTNKTICAPVPAFLLNQKDATRIIN